MKILNQPSTQDNEKEAKIRQHLKQYYDKDIEVLEVLTEYILNGT